MSQAPKDPGMLGSRWFGISAGLIVATIGATIIALVVAGFILAGYLDASGASTIPGIGWLQRLPPVLRTAVEIVVGVPVAFGAALYLITQLLEMAAVATWPVRKLIKGRVKGRG